MNNSSIRMIAIFAAGILVGVFSAIQIVPASVGAKTGVIAGPGNNYGPDVLQTSGGGPVGKQTGGTTTLGGGSNGGGGGGSSGSCATGQNAGHTDQGVDSTTIRLATTVVDSGIGASFLKDVRFAMEAQKIKINAAGGICGRKLDIRYIDDGWDAQQGAQYLRNLIQETDPSKQIFAIPVGPSSEGLRVVINSGDIDAAKMPVVGTDGLLIEQYQKDGTTTAQPWVWPVATATVASARIMVANALKNGAAGASDFSVVFDKNYKFGVEGARAFNAEVKRLTHQDIPGFNTDASCQQQYCGITAGQSSYSTDIANFKPGKIVALFLEPETALTWMNDPNTPAANYNGIPLGYHAAMPLFTYNFGVNCQSKCDQMHIWTSFKPNFGQFQNDPAVRTFALDMQKSNPQADTSNAFAEGGYVGMGLLIQALQQVGSNLTRDALKSVLDSACITPGITVQDKLCWTADDRFADTTMQEFTIQYKGTFAGWSSGDVVQDPRPTAGVGD
ncbi:MAG: ABC transporter substrate-binding protein [Actinomycetota bacterium]